MDAERPMLMPGGGVIIADASDDLMALAEYLQIPVTPTLMGKGAIPEDHVLYAGVVGIQTNQRYANQLFLESDLIVAIGARFADRHTGDLSVYRGNRKFIHIDISPFQIGRVFPPDLGIVSDAKLALQALRQVAGEFTSAHQPGEWVEHVRQLRYTLWRKTDFDNVPIKPQRVYQEMKQSTPLLLLWTGGSAWVGGTGLHWHKAGPAREAGGRRGGRLLLRVPDGGGCGCRPV